MNRIRELRKAKGWRQEDLGEKLHLKKATISRYETGALNIDAIDISRLCDLFGCTADYLIGRSDIPNENLDPEDYLVIMAYHKLPPVIRQAVDGLLEPYMKTQEKTGS